MENFDLGETLYSDEKATRELLNRKDGLQPFDLSRLTLGVKSQPVITLPPFLSIRYCLKIP